MKLKTRYESIPCFEYSDFDGFAKALSHESVWFGLPEGPMLSTAWGIFGDRVAVHQSHGAAGVVVQNLSSGDIAKLRESLSDVFINLPGAMDSQNGGDLVSHLARAGFNLFCPFGRESSLLPVARRLSPIGRLEFLSSDAARCDSYPALTAGTLVRQDPRLDKRRLVFVLDLIQDVEILKPLIVRAAAPFSAFKPLVSVSERIIKSTIWKECHGLLKALDVAWFKPSGPVDVASALSEQRAVLITASESTAPGHAFCHQACRLAPPKTLKVTIQHGYECIGLRHHRAHDLQFGAGVRFASDIVLTWQSLENLIDLHPLERAKCIPVGVVKAFAESAAMIQDERWFGSPDPIAMSSHRPISLLVAENLHSVRFVAPNRYQRFLEFINAAQESPNYELSVRSHPGKRTLEKDKTGNGYKFLEGILTAKGVANFDLFVSPPSTIVLDAAALGLPVAVWSDNAELGDMANYEGLPNVTTLNDLTALPLRKCLNQAHRWAVKNTCALNGVPHAWATLTGLLDM